MSAMVLSCLEDTISLQTLLIAGTYNPLPPACDGLSLWVWAERETLS